MSFEENRQRAGRLRSIPLPSVLREMGARRDRSDKSKWRTNQGTLSVNDTRFFNWHKETGGGGAIDLVIHLHHCPFHEALDWLQHHFPDSIPRSLTEGMDDKRNDRPRPPIQFAMPRPDPGQLPRIKTYLVRERALRLTLIQDLIQSGTLHADRRGNAVFVLLGKEGRAVGAELRATGGTPWRGLAPGSRKDHGYFSLPSEAEEGPIILCESAIDAISCSIIHPGKRCLSTAGARPNPAWLSQLVSQGKEIYCGYDADATGERIAQAMMAKHPSVKRLRPARHDWNAVIKALA